MDVSNTFQTQPQCVEPPRWALLSLTPPHCKSILPCSVSLPRPLAEAPRAARPFSSLPSTTVSIPYAFCSYSVQKLFLKSVLLVFLFLAEWACLEASRGSVCANEKTHVVVKRTTGATLENDPPGRSTRPGHRWLLVRTEPAAVAARCPAFQSPPEFSHTSRLKSPCWPVAPLLCPIP